jgi:hypothetical protein
VEESYVLYVTNVGGDFWGARCDVTSVMLFETLYDLSFKFRTESSLSQQTIRVLFFFYYPDLRTKKNASQLEFLDQYLLFCQTIWRPKRHSIQFFCQKLFKYLSFFTLFLIFSSQKKRQNSISFWTENDDNSKFSAKTSSKIFSPQGFSKIFQEIFCVEIFCVEIFSCENQKGFAVPFWLCFPSIRLKKKTHTSTEQITVRFFLTFFDIEEKKIGQLFVPICLIKFFVLIYKKKNGKYLFGRGTSFPLKFYNIFSCSIYDIFGVII